MGIFRRGRKGEDAVDEAPKATEAELVPETGEDTVDAGDDVVVDRDDIDPSDADDAADEYFSRARGPFDSSETADGDEASRLDLGSIQLAPIDGMQLRLELDDTQQTVLGAHALIADSGVQLQAFAAPKTIGLWQDIRTEIAESIVSQGGTADVVRGPLGRELIARMPSRGPDGRTIFQPVRFLGVDGPRWFLRAVISGTAALEESAAEPLVELVRSVVVVRGDEAKPPREILPLRLPAEIQTSGPPADGADQAGPGDDTGASRRADTLKPFERGPEITEVR